MKRILILGALSLFVVAFVFAEDSHTSTEILIQLTPGVSIGTINSRYGTTTEDSLLKGTAYVVRVSDPGKLDSTVAAMKKDPDIRKVGFNFFGETPEAVRRTIAVIDSAPSLSKYHDQSAYRRIRAAQAQTLSKGAGVVVAVIDTGVDYLHPALVTHMLRDSSNKVIGYDFIRNNHNPMDSSNGIDEDHDGIIDEGAGHGTHVAGIISLVAPDAKIMPLRVLDSDGIGTADSVARAIEFASDYAEEKKVPMVINLSLGFPDPSFVVLDAIQSALELGIPVVAAAGNDNAAPHYPAAYNSVISVTAIGPNGVKASFSNYGKNHVDLSAPGIGIYSTFLQGKYAWWDGTSMAAPFVSGEAALVLSMLHVGTVEDHPTTSILPHLKKGADYIYDVNPTYKPGLQLGSGSVDLYSTLLQLQGADRLTVQKAVYTTNDRVLTVVADSNKAPFASLSIQGIGKMAYDSANHVYTFTGTLTRPLSLITISSSQRGTTAAYVGIH